MLPILPHSKANETRAFQTLQMLTVREAFKLNFYSIQKAKLNVVSIRYNRTNGGRERHKRAAKNPRLNCNVRRVFSVMNIRRRLLRLCCGKMGYIFFFSLAFRYRRKYVWRN